MVLSIIDILIPAPERGQTGRMSYLAGNFDASVNYGVLLTETSCPVVHVVNRSTDEYWYPTDDYSFPSTPGDGVTGWEQAERFGMVLAEVLFTMFAKVGSFVVAGDFFISHYGTLVSSASTKAINASNVNTLYALRVMDNSIVADSITGRVAYTYFDASDPMARTVTSGMKFRPMLVINALTGEQWMADGLLHVRTDGSLEFLGSSGVPGIAIGLKNGIPYLKFYSPEGVEMYDLGYTGLRQLVNNSVPDDYAAVMLRGALVNSDAVPYEDGDDVNAAALYGLGVASNQEPMADVGVWRFIEGYVIINGVRRYNVSGTDSPSAYDGRYYTGRTTSGSYVADGWWFALADYNDTERARHYKLRKVTNGQVVKEYNAYAYESLGGVSDPVWGDEPSNWKYRCCIKKNGNRVLTGYANSSKNIISAMTIDESILT